MEYKVGDTVIYAPKGDIDCYSPVERRWERWPSPFWHPNPGQARRGDRMKVVFIDECAGQQRLWYESPYSPYGPAPGYETPDPGKRGCHNVLAGNVRPDLVDWACKFITPSARFSVSNPTGLGVADTIRSIVGVALLLGIAFVLLKYEFDTGAGLCVALAVFGIWRTCFASRTMEPVNNDRRGPAEEVPQEPAR